MTWILPYLLVGMMLVGALIYTYPQVTEDMRRQPATATLAVVLVVVAWPFAIIRLVRRGR